MPTLEFGLDTFLPVTVDESGLPISGDQWRRAGARRLTDRRHLQRGRALEARLAPGREPVRLARRRERGDLGLGPGSRDLRVATDQGGVAPARDDQLLVGAGFDDAALVENDDLVGVADR